MKKIKVVIEPDLMEVFESPCDIPDSIENTIEELKLLFPKENLDLTFFDTSIMDNEYWFLKNID